jgi:Tol biopolymer transport system component/tRNA A-37 threonylcarbamoyl transferase component Bud32
VFEDPVVESSISHFQILEQIGQGGMGIVYRALDTRLNRAVAIKLLPPDILRDPERQARFAHEARAASALNHPNIITIYEIDRCPEGEFIAMEFVPGETLDAAIRRGPLLLADVLRFGLQGADALTAAHAAGIVHRDLKPANIMITPAGLVKILDFGIAKLIAPTESQHTAGGEAPTDTLTNALGEGHVVGTAPYMSPEHLVGKKVDARSDIFSFGAVLYEMATGRRAFNGENKVAMAAAVLATDPIAPSEIAAALPPELERIILRCLEKDPNRRYQSAAALKSALQDFRDALESGRTVAMAAAGRLRSRLGLGASILLGIVAVLIVTWLVAQPDRRLRPSSIIRLTSDAGLSAHPALSPDGKFVVYASDRAGGGNLDLWLQQIGAGSPIRLTQGGDDNYDPDFSPDGTRIVYRSERDSGGVYLISTLGGEPRLIGPEGRHPRFSPDGNRIAWWTGTVGGDREAAGASKIFVASLTGAPPVQLRPDFASARDPVWLGDGRHLLFAGQGPGHTFGWWVTPIDGGPAVPTGAYELCRGQGLNPKEGSWAARGTRLIFAATSGDSKNLWEIGFSSRDWHVTSGPKRLTFGTGHEVQPSMAHGQVAFASLLDTVQVWMLPLNAAGFAAGEPEQVTRGAADNAQVSLSADGRMLAFISYRAGNYDIWSKDLPAGTEKPLLETRENEYYPTLSPDGSNIAWYVDRNRKRFTFTMSTAGGTPRQVCDDCGTISGWSADNTRLLYIYGLDRPRRSIGLLDVAGGRKTQLLEHPDYSLYQPVFSPDDRWIAFYARLSPSLTRMYVAPYKEGAAPGRESWIAVTGGTSYDFKPRWSHDGNRLYFFSERDRFRCIWMQALDPKTRQPLGPARAICHFHNDKRPLMNVAVNALGLAVGPDKIMFNLMETTGNIWLTE